MGDPNRRESNPPFTLSRAPRHPWGTLIFTVTAAAYLMK
jgi:hypothetical protein